jgi:hypothetical protein
MPKGVPRNVDFFPLIAGLIFIKLYTTFPTPQNLSVEDFDLESIDSDDEPTRLSSLWADTIRWLTSEHYLRFGGESSKIDNGIAFDGLTLTKKGLNALNRPTTTDGQTIIDALLHSLTNLESASGRDRMRGLIQQLLDD